MNELLARVLHAHGGLARWKALSKVRASIVTGGEFWGMKGLVQDRAPRLLTVSLHEERASVMPFGAADQRATFTPDRVAIEKTGGTLVAERSNPRSSFAGHVIDTAWDPLHRAYFNGYALWTYLTTPFLLAMPGVEVEEIEPWQEAGQQWRRLRARFPSHLATHSEVQDFYFDRAFLLRRHDYRVEVAGSFAAAQYVYDYTKADGIRLPTRRRAYRRDTCGQAVQALLMVSIDLSDIRYV
jgi:hypothetical protein